MRHGRLLSSNPSAPPEVRALAASRIALGTLFLLRTTPLFAALHPHALHDAPLLLGFPDESWHGSPTLPLPAIAVAALCIVRTLAALAFTLGVESRAAGLIAGVSGYLVLLQRPFGLINTLHLLFEATILLALTDCGSAYALRRRPARDAASGLLLIRLFVASVYGWAGLSKLRRDWFDGDTLDVLHHMRWLSGSIADVLLSTEGRRAAVATAFVLGELALGPLLLVRRTRLVGLCLAFGFHVAIEVMGRADLLGYEMMALLFCFFPGAWPRPQSGSQRGASAGQAMIP